MTRSPMLLVTLLWCAGLGAAAQFGKISVIYEELRAIYGSNGELALGLVVSVVGIVGLIFGTTAGLIVARIGPKRAIVAALALGALVSAGEAMLPSWSLMILARVLEGGSHLAIVIVGPVMIAGLAPPARRPFAMTLWSSFFAVTYAILALIAPTVLAMGGIPALFIGHAAWMAAFAVILWLVLPADPRAEATPTGSFWAEHVKIYTSPSMSAPAMGFACYTFLYVACLTLLPAHAPQEMRGLMASAMPLISMAISLTLGVYLLGRLPAVRLVQWGFAVSLPGFALLGLGWGQGLPMLIGGLWVAATLGVVQGASFSAIPELNDSPEGRSGAAGAIAQLGNLGTTTGTPLLAFVLANSGATPMVLIAIASCLAGIWLHSWHAKRRLVQG
ncbi:MFS transporter [Xinfangfangia sp. CPCC 101601]|uniref:MFS transporter n=1 Tax=Pseudogemmobacter lacusdianii TaxID=3069608 RepID=A0ABU0VUI6_9RHOB|nr:MFS transporter [Xinfangfangia sp. CPCC 101601]MDQ2065394.1 MFS transporter [Xinfangfangia sp. CPCC 101601]